MVSKEGIEILKQYYTNVQVENECVVAFNQVDCKDYFTKDSDVSLYLKDVLYHSIVG